MRPAIDTTVTEISASDVATLAAGAALLGSGGGGQTGTASIMLRRQLTEHGAVTLRSLDDIDPEALVICTGAVGSTTVLAERLPSGDEFSAAVFALQHHLGAPVSAVMPLEIGGVNALLAALTAARAGLPLIDADAMGRAYPRMTDTTLSRAGIRAAPTAMADSHGTVQLVLSVRDQTVDELVRRSLPALGGWCAVAGYPAPAQRYRHAVVARSVTRALRMGRDLRHAQSGTGADRTAFVTEHGATVLAAGTVLDVSRHGNRAGSVTVTISDATDTTRTLRLDADNEYLLALRDGLVVARTPQPICVLDQRGWSPISPEELTVHQQVEVIALPAATTTELAPVRPADELGLC